jgi:hypothetical protein
MYNGPIVDDGVLIPFSFFFFLFPEPDAKFLSNETQHFKLVLRDGNSFLVGGR